MLLQKVTLPNSQNRLPSPDTTPSQTTQVTFQKEPDEMEKKPDETVDVDLGNPEHQEPIAQAPVAVPPSGPDIVEPPLIPTPQLRRSTHTRHPPDRY